MKGIFSLIVSFILLLPGINGFSQVLQNEFERSINTDALEHPYLLFNKKEKKEMIAEINANKKLSEIYERQILEANRYLRMPLEHEIPTGGDQSRYYDHNEMRSFMSRHYKAAFKLAFAYQMTGDEAYAKKAFSHAEMLCKLDNWAYPFHRFPQIYDRVWPWNVEDDQVVFSFDLQSARIATHLAFVYDWIYEAMDKGQRDRIRGALLENAIILVRGNYDYHWWASAYRCNWSGICYSGLGMASLALLKEDPQLIDAITHSYNGVSSMLGELGIDGGWQEGRGYWAYGIGHSMWFIDAIKRLTAGEYNLLTHPRFKDNPVDFVLYTFHSDFGDGRAGPVGDSWFLNKIISETGNQTAKWYKDKYIECDESIYDLVWREPKVKGVEPEIKSKHFRTIDWAVMQSDFDDEETFTIVSKAGMNDDPHHGHLDCGHFILNYLGENFIRETGKSRYDDFYFSKQRWEYTEASSRGHNLVTVNGEQQIPAKEKDQPMKEGIGGTIDEFYTSDTMDYITMNNLEKAYPGKEMHSWQRNIILEKPNLAVIFDKIGSDKNAEIRSRIHPMKDFSIKEGFFTMHSEKGAVAVIPFSSVPINLESGRHGMLSINENMNFRWVDYVDIVTESKSDQTYTGYMVFPYDDKTDVNEITESIEIIEKGRKPAILTFVKSGKKHEIPVPGN